MATKFSPCKGSYVLNQFPSNVMFGMNGFHISASGAIQGHHGPLVTSTTIKAFLLRCLRSRNGSRRFFFFFLFQSVLRSLLCRMGMCSF